MTALVDRYGQSRRVRASDAIGMRVILWDTIDTVGYVMSYSIEYCVGYAIAVDGHTIADLALIEEARS